MATGWDCPGCGGLRASHQLLHGHWREAFALNPLLVIALPIGAYLALRPLLARYVKWNLPQPFRSAAWVWIAAVIVVVFGVARNLPWRAWFSN
jgi:putative Mn2+ efflux pump MntP